MITFLSLPDKRKRIIYEQVSGKIGILPESVEKDFWVSFILQAIFQHDELGPSLTFKGGTSLSKAWHLIKRFSEDIDLVIDKRALEGVSLSDYTDAEVRPSRGKLKKLACSGKQWVQGTFRDALADVLGCLLGSSMPWALNIDMEVEDGMCLLFTYPTVLSRPSYGGYIDKRVKIEMGPQPDNWPSMPVSLQPMVFEAFPQLASSAPFSVQTIDPCRTLWEKALLLHEIANRANHPDHAGKQPRPRLSRHYYDLYCLLRSEFRRSALENKELFAAIVNHRRTFFKVSGVDYTSMQPGCLHVMPHPNHMHVWNHDYEQMRETMFYDPELPAFDELLHEIKTFEDEFNRC